MAKQPKKEAATAAKSKGGRPTAFTQELADLICERIADGESLRKICESEDMPNKSTVLRWLANEETPYKEFCAQYARAREVQADTLADEILSIADDGLNDTYIDDNGNKKTDQDVIGRSRLRVDARKWLASKMAPKKYGDKVENTLKGDQGSPLVVEIIRYGKDTAS